MIVALDAEAFNALAGPDSIRKQIVTGDERDLERLSAPYPHIMIEPVGCATRT